jgi:hypothetical protein
MSAEITSNPFEFQNICYNPYNPSNGSSSYALAGKPAVLNPLTVPIMLSWLKDDKITFQACKNMRDAVKQYSLHVGRTNLVLTESKTVTYKEMYNRADNEQRVENELAENKEELAKLMARIKELQDKLKQ